MRFEFIHVLNTIWQRKHRGLGHVHRNEVLLLDIIVGRVQGKAHCGRKRLHMLSDLASSATYADCGLEKSSRRSRWMEGYK